jgi:hypothetical protein
MLIYCFNKYVQCQYKHEWQIKVKKLHIFHCFYRFCLVVFIRTCVLNTALVLFGCISPDMCIAYSFGFVWLYLSGYVYCIQLWFCLVAFLRTCVLHTLWFVFFGSLYIQVIQGFIHDDHEDLINKHVMMIRVTDNI